MKAVYNTLVQGASLLLPVAKLAGKKMQLFVEGRADFDQQIQNIKAWRAKQNKVIWFHCASLGEFEQGRPVLESYKARNPDYSVMVTFFSPSGYEVRKNYALADYITYLPLDTPQNAKQFVAAVNAQKVVFVKYEFWANHLQAIRNSGAQLIGISVILRPDQAFFKPWGGFFRNALNQFDFLFLQNKISSDLLDSIGFTAKEIVGDTRFDRVIATAQLAEDVEGIAEFVEHKKTMIVGSAWPEDMQVLLPFIKAHPEMKFIIAPHEIKVDQIQQWALETGAVLYSEKDKYKQQNVMIIDCIGLLSKLYKYGHYAWVGGGYRTGLHNILEPAVFGMPIFFGNKKYKKFQEALDLIALGVAFPIDQELESVFHQLDVESIRKTADQYVNQNAGATQKIIQYLES